MEFSFSRPMSTSHRSFGVGALIGTLAIGIIFIAVGYFVITSFKIDSSWKRVTGTVISESVSIQQNNNDSNNINSSNNSITYAPIVEYVVSDVKYQKQGSVSSSSHPTIGSSRQVAYNPNNPGDAKIVESNTTQMLFWLFPIVGLLVLLFAPFAFWRSKKSRASNEFESSLPPTYQADPPPPPGYPGFQN